ncbi:MAG: HAD family hydrolase [Acidobacteria bacterium]|nr:HAD family hydrolase [Acidobacteriota bacterium]
MAIQAISFDFWNTLFTEAPGGFKLYQERRRHFLQAALNAEGGNFTEAQIEQAARLEAESHHLIWSEQYRTLTASQRLARVLHHLNASLPEAAMANIVRAYEEGIHERPPVLVRGALLVVEQLAKRYRLGIISDIGFSPGRVLKQLMRQAGILEAFDSLVFSDEAGCAKPHANVFAMTAATLGARPQEMVHIGDLEPTDIIGAKRANFYAIRFVGVTPMQKDETTIADAVTADFTAIPRIIESLGGKA